jgi:hypothetical protein
MNEVFGTLECVISSHVGFGESISPHVGFGESISPEARFFVWQRTRVTALFGIRFDTGV